MKEKILIPNTLSIEEINDALRVINKSIEEGKIREEDYILVDTLNGEINIKAFKGDIFEDLVKKLKISPRELLMIYMRDQNNEGVLLKGSKHPIEDIKI